MKASNIITHSYTLIFSYLIILISGEHLGGFFLLYLLLGLPHGAAHSLIGLAGTGLLIANNISARKSGDRKLKNIVNLTGAFALVTSLLIFFNSDKEGYNNGTFYQLVPRITLVLYGIVTISFIAANLLRLLGWRKNTKQGINEVH